MIAVPTFHQRESAGEKQWSVLIPIWDYEGRGYLLNEDAYRYGPWRFYVRLTVAKSYHGVSFRLNWGSVGMGV